MVTRKPNLKSLIGILKFAGLDAGERRRAILRQNIEKQLKNQNISTEFAGILRRLFDKKAAVREEQVRLLADTKSNSAAPLLIMALHDSSIHVRWTAAEALGEIGGRKEMLPLCQAMSSKDYPVANAAKSSFLKICNRLSGPGGKELAKQIEKLPPVDAAKLIRQMLKLKPFDNSN